MPYAIVIKALTGICVTENRPPGIMPKRPPIGLVGPLFFTDETSNLGSAPADGAAGGGACSCARAATVRLTMLMATNAHPLSRVSNPAMMSLLFLRQKLHACLERHRYGFVQVTTLVREDRVKTRVHHVLDRE